MGSGESSKEIPRVRVRKTMEVIVDHKSIGEFTVSVGLVSYPMTAHWKVIKENEIEESQRTVIQHGGPRHACVSQGLRGSSSGDNEPRELHGKQDRQWQARSSILERPLTPR